MKIIAENAHWYCGTELKNKPPEKSQVFDCGGYAIWKTKLNNDLNIHLCMYLSELGLGKLAAHGHADSLSFTLNINGEPVFIDPGTYAYHDEKNGGIILEVLALTILWLLIILIKLIYQALFSGQINILFTSIMQF